MKFRIFPTLIGSLQTFDIGFSRQEALTEPIPFLLLPKSPTGPFHPTQPWSSGHHENAMSMSLPTRPLSEKW
jgi:hypothetical protein